MNCPQCNHPAKDHQARGCYHLDNKQPNKLCSCKVTPAKIQIDALQAENAKLRAALEQISSITPSMGMTGSIAREALKGQAE